MPVDEPHSMPRRGACGVPGGAHDPASSGPQAEHALRRQALGGDWMRLMWLSCSGRPRVAQPARCRGNTAERARAATRR
eukprot:12849802-Alexandrium_andersonii.AAC.1